MLHVGQQNVLDNPKRRRPKRPNRAAMKARKGSQSVIREPIIRNCGRRAKERK
jgi:hypothetical protein